MGYKIEANPEKLEAFANNIVKELAFLEEQADNLDAELNDIIRFCSPEYLKCFNGVGNTFVTSDRVIERLDKHERDIRSASNKLQDQDDLLSKLFNLYDSYDSMVIFGGSLLGSAKYLATGATKFVIEDGKYIVKNMDFLDDISRMVDNSKYKNWIKAMVSPSLLNFKNKSISELLFKRMTTFFPSDAADFTNDVRNWTGGVVNDLGMKVTYKDVIKTGVKFAKGNVLLSLAVTTGSETFGASTTIADNYNKYGNNPEVLKRENTKAVAKAVNNTFWVTAGTGVGTVIGGALGSLGTPAGTVIGGAVGGALGSYAGEKMAGLTAGFVESFALKHDDTIQKGISTIRNIGGDVSKGIEKVSKVATTVKDEVNKQLNNGSKIIEKGINNAKEKVAKEIDKVGETANSMIKDAKDFLANPFSFG